VGRSSSTAKSFSKTVCGRSSRAQHILTPDRRLRVFVSSTLQELAEERAAASEAISTLQMAPVLFELGARPHPPQALYRSYLEQSEVFVGIYWQSYGWVAPGADVSGIEDEYRLSAGKPRLVYVKEPAEEREPRLTELLDTLQAEGSASYKSFESADELREHLLHDLALLVTERFAGVRDTPLAQDLPAQSTSFVGRGDELAEIEALLGDGDVRLLTLTGPGGIGKTRLAVEAADRLRGRFEDGVAFVALDGLQSPDVVAATIAGALGIRDAEADPLESLRAYLVGRELLVLLDNFEHVVAAAPLVAALLESAPGLTILATSRELLRLRGERELRIPPLAPETDAAALFVERATAVLRSFELSGDNEPQVTEICRRLDGVPLAIELAAPQLRLLTPDQLLERLRQRFELTGPRDAPARQRTLEAAIAWSYELLEPQERRLFERLSVFHGTFKLEAAQEVAALEADVLDLLAALLDKSLVYPLPQDGDLRFGMLRMIREFAVDRLAEAGELDTMLERLAGYYLRLAEQAEEGLRSTAQRQWKRTLDLEADNLRAVLAWAIERDRGNDAALLVRGLWLWFWLHGNLGETRDWVARSLACSEEIEVRNRGWLYLIGGAFAVLEGEFEAGAADLPNAARLLAEAGDRRGMATVGIALGYGAAPLKGVEFAHAQLAETLALFEELNDLWGIGSTLHAICRLRTVYDDYEGAGDVFERSLAAVEEIGDDLGIALSLINLADARLAAGRDAEAREVIGRLFEHMRSTGITYAGEDLLELLARIARVDGGDEHAVELLAAADSLRERLHTPRWQPALERHEAFLEALRAALGAHRFEAAYERGRAQDVAEAQEAAMRLLGPD
jgi:predicted ATPase